MSFSPLIDELVSALQCLPGVGKKSAQRMALQLLERNRDGGQRLARALGQAMDAVGHCSDCRTLCETECCDICTNPRRSERQLCVVESPGDILAIEHSGGYDGKYFVLMGHLSPIDGLGPEQIGIPDLLARARRESVEEVIIATNPTVEGEATAHFIAEQLQGQVVTSRIAHGVPVGGELGYVDGGTLMHAFNGRTRIQASDHNPADAS